MITTTSDNANTLCTGLFILSNAKITFSNCVVDVVRSSTNTGSILAGVYMTGVYVQMNNCTISTTTVGGTIFDISVPNASTPLTLDNVVYDLAKVSDANSNITDIDRTINTNLGTPISLDSGTATLAGMLTKMSDDNAGADFDAETDSLAQLQTSIAAGFPTAVTQDSGNITTSTETAGTVSNTELDDGVYWQIAAAAAVGGFGMNADIVFAVGTDRTAATVFVNARESFSGGSSFVLVWAFNYVGLGDNQRAE